MRKHILIAVPLLFGSNLLAASLGAVSGKVLDSSGASIKDAYVIFHADLAGRTNRTPVPDQTRKTDAAGTYKIRLQPGFYDVCVMASAFSPDCKKVFVSSRATGANFKLKADSLVSEHLADTF